MHRMRCTRSRSSQDLVPARLTVIEDLLDGPRSRGSRTNLASRIDESSPNEKGEEKQIDYWPNCDASIWLRSCEKEVIVPMHGKLTGKIPVWLKGTLLRNGPGSLKVGEETFGHLFDGSALLHRFAIFNGDVTYQRRFVRTDVYKRNNAAGRIVVTEFGTRAVPDPCQSIFHRVAAAFRPMKNLSDNTMISVCTFGDEYYTLTEGPVMHRIDPETLETKGKINVSDYVHIVHHTSHPHVTNEGTVYNLGMSLTARGPAYSVVQFPPSSNRSGSEENDATSVFDRATVVATLPSRWLLNPSYMHTFGITENYFVIVEQPLALSLVSVASRRFWQEPLAAALKWHAEENTLIHLVPRTGVLPRRTFTAERFFFLHIINQFETGDGKYVVLDICCYRDSKMIDCMYIDALKNIHKNPDYPRMFRGRPLRFVLPTKIPESDVPLEKNLIEDYHVTSRRSNDCETNGKKDRARRTFEERASAHRFANGSVFVKPELLCDIGCETPRLNSALCLGKQYRYFYAISSDVDLQNPGTIIKVDTVRKSRTTWCEKNVYPSEPIFVPNPDAKREDDGVILSALVWGQGRETEVGLLILDAASFTEIGRATFDTPGPVPKCLHGWFTLGE